MHQILKILTILSMLSAGCVGSSGSPASPSTEEAQVDDPASEERHAWWNGTVGGLGTPWVSYTPDEPQHRFQVSNATELDVSVTTDGGEVWAWFYPPGCSSDDDEERCSYIVRTRDGSGELTVDDPEPGTWNASVGRADTGYGEVDFRILLAWR